MTEKERKIYLKGRKDEALEVEKRLEFLWKIGTLEFHQVQKILDLMFKIEREPKNVRK